ncbi:MAG: hypothetical protein WD876_03740 [Candidatus Pacearchaeota archaeon]
MRKYIEYVLFEEARKFARTLRLKSYSQWFLYCRGHNPELPLKPINIPNSPHAYYVRSGKGTGWTYWADFLGHQKGIDKSNAHVKQQITISVGPKPQERWMGFEELKEHIHGLKLKTSTEYAEWHRNNGNDKIPAYPKRYYKDQWKSWKDFIGESYSKKFAINNEIIPPYVARFITKTPDSRDIRIKKIKEFLKPRIHEDN